MSYFWENWTVSIWTPCKVGLYWAYDVENWTLCTNSDVDPAISVFMDIRLMVPQTKRSDGQIDPHYSFILSISWK
jgi:hypothetical protein